MSILENATLVAAQNPFDICRNVTIPHDTAKFSSPITRMLLSSDGLTTTLLESFTGLRAHVSSAEHHRVSAEAAPPGAADLLRVPPDGELLFRRSTMATVDGRPLSANQVVARTDIPGTDRCLTDESAPLGFALHAAGTGFRRTVLDVGVREWDGTPPRPAAFKTYVLWHRDTPSVVISELFNPEIISAEIATTAGAHR